MSSLESYIQLEKELSRYKKMMAQAIDVMIDQEVSNYPIFVAHQQEVEIGIPITSEIQNEKWSIHASSLEEFVSKQIIEPNKVEDFQKNFKDPKMFSCLFVLSELGAQFIFLPRK